MNAFISQRLLRLAVLLVAGLSLAACDSARNVLGLSKTAPDETRVTVLSPLVVPPDFNLRPPGSGGVDRSQLPQVPRRRQTGAVITGDGRIVGGVTGEESLPEDVTPGELALLRQAGALTPPAGIRGLAAQQEQAAARLNRLLTDLILFDGGGERRQPSSRERSSIEKAGLF